MIHLKIFQVPIHQVSSIKILQLFKISKIQLISNQFNRVQQRATMRNSVQLGLLGKTSIFFIFIVDIFDKNGYDLQMKIKLLSSNLLNLLLF